MAVYGHHFLHSFSILGPSLGFPFDCMSEEVGRELGSKLGRYIESDKRSWLPEQAKFIRIRVDLPIDKPLQKGGNIVNIEGEKIWVSFKYERLPNFCFFCGLLGHDEKHCQEPPSDLGNTKQYGDWLRANGFAKLSSEKSKVTFNGRPKRRKEDCSNDKHNLAKATSNSTNMESEQAELPTTPRSYTLPNNNTASGNSDMSNHLTANNQLRNKKVSPLNPKPQSKKFQFEIQKSLETGREIGDNDSSVGLLKPSLPEAQEFLSPLKPSKKAHYTSKSPCTPRGPSKGNLKKIAKIGRAHV